MNYSSLKFHNTVSRFSLDKAMLERKFVIAAYSGGADSSCLLRFLHRWCSDNSLTLAAAHINHMIRGEDADRDEEFCRNTCKSLGIPIFVLREDVPKLAAESGRGLEETAREVRYSFFDKVSEELTGDRYAAAVVTAHNADDNLETVIFNILRGAGSRGLSGIDPVRDGRYLRPLIGDNGADIRKWCADNDVEYVTDCTNTDTDYTRNYIRHELTPKLYAICDSPQNSVLRMSTSVRQDCDFIDSTAAAYVREGEVSFSRDKLRSLHPAVGSRIVRLLYGNAGTGKPSLEEVHIRSILELVSSDITEGSVSLPNGLTASTDRYTVTIGRKIQSETENIRFVYPDDGEIFENGRYLIRLTHGTHTNITRIDENIYKLFICKSFCFDKIKGVLHIRYREQGDTILSGGIRKKVKKLFIDKKLTSAEKAETPILCDSEGILWIPGFAPADGFTATEDYCGELLMLECYIRKNPTR